MTTEESEIIVHFYRKLYHIVLELCIYTLGRRDIYNLIPAYIQRINTFWNEHLKDVIDKEENLYSHILNRQQ